MSSGKFSTEGKYEADSGQIHRIRVQPETINAGNAVPAGAVNATTSARVGGGNRRIGLKARSITLRWKTTPPTGYADGLVRIPIFGAANFASLTLGADFTYLGTTAVIVGKNPERVR